MIVKRKKKFIKSYEKLNRKIQDKFDKSLRNHTLTWEYLWYRSIDITWDYRVIFKEYPNWTYEFVDFIDIWTHSQLYW